MPNKRKHRLTALAAALCLLCSGLPATGITQAPITSYAAEEKLTFGDLTYTVENDEVTITGCDAAAASVEIPAKIDGKPVVRIGATAFYDCALTSVAIPEGVTAIASGAFWHSHSLTEVTLPSTLETIESFAFNDTAVASFSIPKSVSYIGNSAFGDTPWIAAQKEQNPFVIVNGILIDASQEVVNQQDAINADKQARADAADAARNWVRAGVMANQVGYFQGSRKCATVVNDSTALLTFELHNDQDEVVYQGTASAFGTDADSGDTVQILDFSAFDTEGVYTICVSDGSVSKPFRIGVNAEYSGMLTDALNYFYQARSGIAIESQYITSGDREELARTAGHAPDIAEIQQVWGYEGSSGTQDVSGGWYDAGDHGKYVVNGGISLWLLQNQYEHALRNGTAAAYADGTMQIPENQNGFPDLLDESRYEMEWMLRMLVQDGDYKDMAYHKVHDAKWTALGLDPAKDTEPRILLPPTTAATLNVSACAAQSYRLWKELDPDFAEQCLTAAKNTYAAAKAHPDMLAPNKEVGGGGAYNDDNVSDEFYWAACELYLATGDEAYYNDLKTAECAFQIPYDLYPGDEITPASFDWGRTTALGSFSLLLHEELTPAEDYTNLVRNVTAAGDYFLDVAAHQGYGVPYGSDQSGFAWGSNSFVADNAIVLAYACDVSEDAKYLTGMTAAMDYLLGRNPMDISYVTGYGTHTSQYPHHRFWAKSLKKAFPKAPCGVLVGGPNSGLEDDAVKLAGLKKEQPAPEKCYLDSIEAYSVNECTINWNSPLTWVTSYLLEQNGGIQVGAPSAGVQLPEAPTSQEIMEEVIPITVTIPDGVEVIGEQIFGKVKDSVYTAILPDSVKVISNQAFYRCSHLSDLNIPENIQTVGDNAFADTPWLKAALADSQLLIIGDLLINGTAAKGDVVIPDGVHSILGSAFKMNEDITSVTFPEGLTSIGDSAFNGCAALTSAAFPASLRTIGASAFAGTALGDITIPSGIRSIGDEAFVNCMEMQSVTVDNRNVALGQEAFGCTSTFTANGQYSYIFVHRVREDFTVRGAEGSTAALYAKATGLPFEAIEVTASTPQCGDVNGDDAIDILDCICLNKYLLGIGELDPAAKDAADTDANDEIDSTDSLNILKYIVELLDSLPVA